MPLPVRRCCGAMSAVILLLVRRNQLWPARHTAQLLDADVPLANVVGPLESLGTAKQLPISVPPFTGARPGVGARRSECRGHVVVLRRFRCPGRGHAIRFACGAAATTNGREAPAAEVPPEATAAGLTVTAWARIRETTWFGTPSGSVLLHAAGCAGGEARAVRHRRSAGDAHYGVGCRLAGELVGRHTAGTQRAVDPWPVAAHSRSRRIAGRGHHGTGGRQGRPAVDRHVARRGAFSTRRAGSRSGSIARDDDTCRTTTCWRLPVRRTAHRTSRRRPGVSRIALVQTTLADKARVIENRVNRASSALRVGGRMQSQ